MGMAIAVGLLFVIPLNKNNYGTKLVMPKGAKYGGRKAGTTNKITATAKESIMEVFAMLGGQHGMYKWAQDNQGDFYKHIWAKIIPADVQAKIVHQFEPLIIKQHEE